MKAIYLLSILSFWNHFAFAQVPVYSVHSGLSNTVMSIQEVGDSKLLLLADKSANIVLWNPASERTVASYKSLQDELLQVVLDEEYVILVGNRGLEFFQKEELLSSMSFRPHFSIEQDELSDAYIDEGNRMLWLSSFSGHVYRLNLDIPENTFLEEVYFADEFTKSIHVKGNIIQLQSPFSRTLVEIDQFMEAQVHLSEKLGASEYLKPIKTEGGLIGGGTSEIQFYPSDPSLKIEGIRRAPLTSALCLLNDGDSYLLGDREGRLIHLDAKGKETLLFQDSATTISAIYAAEDALIFGDYFGKVYRMSRGQQNPRLVLNPGAATEMNGVYMLPNERMITTHLNLNGSYLRIWKLDMAELEEVITIPSFEITEVEWSVNGDSILVIHSNAEVNLIYRSEHNWKVQQVKPGEVAFIPGAAINLMDKNKYIKRSEALDYWNSAKSYSQEFRMNRSEFVFMDVSIHGMKLGELPHPNIIEELFVKAEMGEFLEKWDIMDRDIFVMKLFRSDNLEDFKQRVSSLGVSEKQLETIFALAHQSGTEFHFHLEDFSRSVRFSSTPNFFDWSPDGRFAIFYFDEHVVIHDLKQDMVDTLILQLNPLQLYPAFGADKCALANRSTAEIYLFLAKEDGLEQIRCLPYGLRSYLFIDEQGFYKQYGPAASISAHSADEKLSFEQLDLYYNRPHLLLKVLDAPNSEIDLYAKVFKRRLSSLGLSPTELRVPAELPEISSPELENAPYAVSTAEFNCTVQLENREDLAHIQVLVNGVPILFNPNSTERITFSLQAGINQVELFAKFKDGSESQRIVKSIFGNFESPPAKTFFIGMAANNYQAAGHNLKFVENDIRVLDSTLKQSLGSNYASYLYLGSDLKPEVVHQIRMKLEKASVNDRIIVAFSGHGLLNSDQQFFLSTPAVDFSNPERGGIAYDSLMALFDGLTCRNRLVLLDACHSGLQDIEAPFEKNKGQNGSTEEGAKGDFFAKLANQNRVFELLQSNFAKLNGRGVQVITAAGGADFAYEDPKLQYSYFTKAILEFLESEGDQTVSLLKAYVDQRVPELSGGKQRPTSREENVLSNWRLDE